MYIIYIYIHTWICTYMPTSYKETIMLPLTYYKNFYITISFTDKFFTSKVKIITVHP